MESWPAAWRPESALPADAILAVVNQTPLLHRYETGLMSDREFFEAVVAATGFRGGETEFLAWFGDIFTEIGPMVALQQALVGRGVPTYVFSNTNAQAIRHVRQSFPSTVSSPAEPVPTKSAP
jgi:hypothetical protein